MSKPGCGKLDQLCWIWKKQCLALVEIAQTTSCRKHSHTKLVEHLGLGLCCGSWSWFGIPSYSRGSSQPRYLPPISWVSCIGKRILYHWATREAQNKLRAEIKSRGLEWPLVFWPLLLVGGSRSLIFKWSVYSRIICCGSVESASLRPHGCRMPGTSVLQCLPSLLKFMPMLPYWFLTHVSDSRR